MPSAGPVDRVYRFEHFWLCEVCAKAYKLVVENGGVSTRPMFLQLTAGKAEAVSIEEERQVA